MLNKLWPLVNDRLNFFTPTKKPIDWGEDRAGRRKRIYDVPKTPFDRLVTCGTELQGRLIELAKDKTDGMRDKLHPKLPDTNTGIKIREAG